MGLKSLNPAMPILGTRSGTAGAVRFRLQLSSGDPRMAHKQAPLSAASACDTVALCCVSSRVTRRSPASTWSPSETLTVLIWPLTVG